MVRTMTAQALHRTGKESSGQDANDEIAEGGEVFVDVRGEWRGLGPELLGALLFRNKCIAVPHVNLNRVQLGPVSGGDTG